jgi:hypothetical protein
VTVWYVLAGILVLLLFRLTLSARKYARIFAGTHYAEIADLLGPARDAAAERANDPPEENPSFAEEDPRLFVSSAGLAVGYSAARKEDGFEHRLTVALTTSYTTRAVGEAFALFVAEAMSWPMDRARFVKTEQRTFHGQVTLSEAEHEAWASGPAPTAADTEVWRDRAAAHAPRPPFPDYGSRG